MKVGSPRATRITQPQRLNTLISDHTRYRDPLGWRAGRGTRP